MKTKIQTLLNQAGVPPSYLGYAYLCYAIELIMQDRSYLFRATKLLYPDVAAYFDVSPSSIERNIRTLLNVYWNIDKGKRLEELTGYHAIYQPTTREFIAVVVEYLGQP